MESNLGMAILGPLDCTKKVFVAAVGYGMCILPILGPFGDEIKSCARDQIVYMLDEDGDTPLVTADEDVKSEIRRGLSHMFSMFHADLSQLILQPGLHFNIILHNFAGIQWLCNVLPKMNLMRDFVFKWADLSGSIIRVVEHLESAIWMLSFKLKLIEVTAKVFDAVSYGTVIVPATSKMQLLNTWLPYIQKMKPVFDSLGTPLLNTMDEDLCQTIQGAIVSMIVTLPSNDQAHILSAWMESQHLGYPDLTEAFEIWCYRTKSSKRRLVHGLDRVSNGSPTSDLSA